MADPMTIVAVVGTVLSVGGQVMGAMQAQAQGEAQQKALNARAEAERRQAVQAGAEAQQKAIQDQRRAAYVLSNERAAAAASGAGASDPTIATNEGRIGAQGQYNFDTSLYAGNVRAANLETQASYDTWEGEQAKAAGDARMVTGLTGAAGSALSGGKSLYEKYGDSSKPIDASLSPSIYQDKLIDRYSLAYKATT